MKFNRLKIAVLSLATALLLVACGNNEGVNKDQALLTGNNDINITQGDLYNKMKENYGKSTLQQLMLKTMFEKEVGSKKAEQIRKDAEKQVADAKKQMGNEKFAQTLQAMQIPSEEAYADTLDFYALTTAALGKQVEITDKDLQKAADEDVKLTVSHIISPSEAQAKEIIKELDNGADFATLAKEKSIDSSSKDKGGSLGTLSSEQLDQMVPEFSQAAKKLKKAGDYTETPVKTQYGYHIIKLDKAPEKGNLKDASYKDQLRQKLVAKKLSGSDETADLINNLIKKYNIKVKDKDLQSIVSQFDPTRRKALKALSASSEASK